MTRMRRTCLVVALALALIGTPAVHAHILLPAEFREVVHDATLIVRGRVTDLRAVRVPGAGIETIATVAVESVLKGQGGRFVYVRVPGGEIAGRRSVMVGAPRFAAGQRAVFFLRPSSTDTSYLPIGLTLGIYRVQPDPFTGRPVIHPPVVTGRTAGAVGSARRGDTQRKLMLVPEFESLVRLVMAAAPGQAVPRGRGR
jgi:hypothetical protein